MKFNGPKVKLSRRLGVPLTAKSARLMERGHRVSASREDRRLSDYGLQLLEKQRLRFQYNVSERQMRRYYQKASGMRGRTGTNLLILLERRLDAFTLRCGFAPTIFAARQLSGHGHFEINGKSAKSPSQALKPGDTVRVREKSRDKPLFDMDWNAYAPPTYIERDTEALTAQLVRLPERDEIPVICEEHYVVEFYSR